MATPRSFVLIQTVVSNGRITHLSLICVHKTELEVAGEPRVLDKLLLNLNNQRLDENAANQIHCFLKLQANPVCFIEDESSSGHVLILGRELKKLGVPLSDECLYAKLQNLPNENSNSGDDSLDSIEDKNIGLLRRLKTNPASLTDLTFLKVSKHIEELDAAGTGANFANTVNNSVGSSDEILVYLDLETTGLKSRKITELCMIAIAKQDLLATAEDDLPTVYDKLVLVVDPVASIDNEATLLTNLSNESIKRNEKMTFNSEVTQMLVEFLDRCKLRGQVFFVAHGGDRFDFDLLRAHLLEIPAHLPRFADIRTFDTVMGFRKMPTYTGRRSLTAIYENCFPEREMVNAHTAEGDVFALLAITKSKPGVFEWVDAKDFIQPSRKRGHNPDDIQHQKSRRR